MEYVCPICNSMSSYLFKCNTCGGQMENKGTIQDYLDDYSPYLPLEITQRVDGVGEDKCAHIFYCRECNHHQRIAIDKVYI